MTSSSVTPLARSRSGSTCTWSIWRRSPQIGTLATPGTRNNLARIFQYEIIDMSIVDSVSDVRPIFMVRLVAESGWIMNGGLAQLGSVGTTVAIRSATSCLAVRRSVPCSKISSICDSCSIDRDRMTSRSGMPLSTCSSGTVTSDSTSDADRPSAGVCTSTRGGANSGNTSIGACRSWVTPTTIKPAASATTMNRNLRLLPITHRNNMAAPYFPTPTSVPNSSGTPMLTTVVPASGPDVRYANVPSSSIGVTACRT